MIAIASKKDSQHAISWVKALKRDASALQRDVLGVAIDGEMAFGQLTTIRSNAAHPSEPRRNARRA